MSKLNPMSSRMFRQALSFQSMRYRSRHPSDAAIRARLHELAAVRRRCDYRRLDFFLGQEGFVMKHKKLCRLYREERLQMCRRGGSKRAVGTRAPMSIPQGATHRWNLDFASDALTDGRQARMPDAGALGGFRVAGELDTIIAERGRPATCVSDNGNGVYQHGDAALVAGAAGRMALHRARQTAAECLSGILHWTLARRMPERDFVHITRPCPRCSGRLERRLQARIRTPICLCH